MTNRTTLKRLERLAQRRREPQDAFADYERAKVDDMTDEELARHVEALAQVLQTLNDAGALGDVLKDAGLELEELDQCTTTSGN